MLNLIIICLFFNITAQADRQEPHLRNISQVTFPSMGFEKSGEGYFSPDGKMIIFQAVHT